MEQDSIVSNNLLRLISLTITTLWVTTAEITWWQNSLHARMP